MGQPRLPVGRQQIRPVRDGVDIVGQGQGEHVRLEAVDHGPSLLAGPAVGHLDVQRLAGRLQPVIRERGVVILVQFRVGS